MIDEVEYLSAYVVELARAQTSALAAVFAVRARLFQSIREMHAA